MPAQNAPQSHSKIAIPEARNQQFGGFGRSRRGLGVVLGAPGESRGVLEGSRGAPGGVPGGSWEPPGRLPGVSGRPWGGSWEVPGGPWGPLGGVPGGPGGVPGGPGSVLGGVPGGLGRSWGPKTPPEADVGSIWGRFGVELGARSLRKQCVFRGFLWIFVDYRECVKIHKNPRKNTNFGWSGVQIRPQIGPQMAPKTAQEAPKTAQEAPKTAQKTLKRAPRERPISPPEAHIKHFPCVFERF